MANFSEVSLIIKICSLFLAKNIPYMIAFLPFLERVFVDKDGTRHFGAGIIFSNENSIEVAALILEYD